MANTTTDLPPPPGCQAGGIWGKNKYVGTTTQGAACVGFLCFCIPGLLILCFPCDERDAYKVNNKVYTADGTLVNANGTGFVASGPQAVKTQTIQRE